MNEKQKKALEDLMSEGVDIIDGWKVIGIDVPVDEDWVVMNLRKRLEINGKRLDDDFVRVCLNYFRTPYPVNYTRKEFRDFCVQLGVRSLEP